MRKRWVILLLSGVLGCAGRSGPGVPGPLAGSLEVQVNGDTVWLGLHVTNVTTAPLELEFTSGQRFDFEVRTAGGESVWRWSADRSFLQALGTERLEPGETWEERVQWIAGGRTGAHEAVGLLVASNHPVELRAGFELGRE